MNALDEQVRQLRLAGTPKVVVARELHITVADVESSIKRLVAANQQRKPAAVKHKRSARRPEIAARVRCARQVGRIRAHLAMIRQQDRDIVRQLDHSGTAETAVYCPCCSSELTSVTLEYTRAMLEQMRETLAVDRRYWHDRLRQLGAMTGRKPRPRLARDDDAAITEYVPPDVDVPGPDDAWLDENFPTPTFGPEAA